MDFIEYNSEKLIEFYKENGLEFDENKGYFGKNTKSFILKENNIIIGAVTVSNYKDKNFIEALAVDKLYRNKNYGRALLEKAINELEKPIYVISKIDKFYLKNKFKYDNTDLIGKECKECKMYNKNCFPRVLVYN